MDVETVTSTCKRPDLTISSTKLAPVYFAPIIQELTLRTALRELPSWTTSSRTIKFSSFVLLLSTIATRRCSTCTLRVMKRNTCYVNSGVDLKIQVFWNEYVEWKRRRELSVNYPYCRINSKYTVKETLILLMSSCLCKVYDELSYSNGTINFDTALQILLFSTLVSVGAREKVEYRFEYSR